MTSSLTQTRTFELTAVIGTICAFSFSVGFIYPVIALSLEAWGYDEAAIGLNATASGLGVLVAGFFIPRLIRVFGTFSLLAGGVVLCVVTFLLMPVFTDYWSWIVFRIVLAMSVAALFSAGEAWINAVAEDGTRARTMAIYVAAMASSFAAGSGAVKLTGYEGFFPFLVASLVVLVCFLPVVPFHKTDPLAEKEPLDKQGDVVWAVLRGAVALMVVVVMFGALDAVILGLFPSYSLAMGVPDTDASIPLAVMAFGVVLLQFPLGYLGDRMNRMRLLTAILLLVVVMAPFVPMVDQLHWTGLVFLAIFGGLTFAPYTLALTVLGERYRGQRLAAGAALFAMMWGLGGLAGPVAFGLAMESMGVNALPYGLGLMFLLTAGVSLLDRASATKAARDPAG